MNKQEFKEGQEVWVRCEFCEYAGANQAFVLIQGEGALAQLYDIKDSEPKKVVIPKFVAEWIEDFKQTNYTIPELLSSCMTDEVDNWYHENSEQFMRAWLDGYEVEREKLYTVEIPNPNEDEFLTVLVKAFDGKVFIDRTANVNWRHHKPFQLTEAEIRKDFDWAWQWAEEVKEVE